MAGWHHGLNGDESEQALGDSEGQGRLARCSPWGHKELERTERLNNDKYELRVLGIIEATAYKPLHL